MPYPNKATEVQPTANTQTCLPISNYGEYRKAPFNLFSATANRRQCLKKNKSLRRTAKGANLFLSTTANRKIGLFFFFAYGELEKRCPFLFAYGEKKGRNNTFHLRPKVFRAQHRVLRCAQPASRRLLHKRRGL